MRAIRRARMSSAAMRAASSSCSQADRRTAWRKRVHRRIGWIEKGQVQLHGWLSFCGADSIGRPWRASMTLRSRSKSPRLPRVRGRCRRHRSDRRSAGMLSPQSVHSAGMSERLPSGKTDKQEEDAAAPDAADHGERPALEGMALAGDRHRIRNITAMGSLPPLPSTASIMRCSCVRSGDIPTARGCCSMWSAG